jgi:hypothetical protein
MIRPITCRAVVQAFDWRFARVASAVPEWAALGYSDVLVSPPQASNEAVWQWWGRYQPTGYAIGGPLGSADAFAQMARVARAHGVRVIVDVVACNPCGRRDLICGVPAQQGERAFQAGLDYLQALAGLGAGGFRFDGADRLPPSFFAWALPRLGGAPAVGEMVTDRVSELARYGAIPGLRMFDFPLLATLRAAFAPGGDLRTLCAPAMSGGALPDHAAMTFVRNHDIERGQARDKGIEDSAYRARFGVGWNEATQYLDRAQVDMAHAVLFARRDGVPCVLAAMRTLPDAERCDRPEDPTIVAGLRFRAASGRADEVWLLATTERLVWQRGVAGLAAVNRADAPLCLAGLRTTLPPGRYPDLLDGPPLCVTVEGRIAGGRVGPRKAALFAVVSSSPIRSADNSRS